jgi:hypothetical protein
MKWLLSLTASILIFALPATAGAAAPTRERQTSTGSVTFDFGCGFDVRNDWDYLDLVKQWTTKSGGFRISDHARLVDVYTNATTGKSITVISNFVVTDLRSTGGIEVGTIFSFTLRGVNFRVKTSDGNVVSSGNVREVSRVIEVVRDEQGNILFFEATFVSRSTPHLVHFIPFREENLCPLLSG